MTVERLLDEMDSAEFGEWMEFAAIEPFGPGLDDYRSGVIAAAHLNPMREKGSPAVKPLDFFPWHEEQRRAVDPSLQIKAMIHSLRP